ncbi:hypothetical protein [Carnobacterium mobile]|uniref:hypothetical protein n=1 Tax=Carnobacterium mobile TaxID=2750 RepID=UPI0018690D43|nr:hypothetical protein [Carnobacterium mobile]
MKKWMVIIGAAFLMAGCDMVGNKGNDSSNSSAASEKTAVSSESMAVKESSSSETQSEVSSEESIMESSTVNEDSSEGAGAGGNLRESKGGSSSETEKTANEIPLVPQKSDIENGFTLETDPVLQEIETRIKSADSIGIPNDVAIHFTGMYLNETGKTQAIFILVNLTEISMTNIQMSISFSNTSDEVILDKKALSLTEDKFGILEPNTAMPLYVDIPKEKEDIFYDLKDFSEMVYSIDSFDYEEAKN